MAAYAFCSFAVDVLIARAVTARKGICRRSGGGVRMQSLPSFASEHRFCSKCGSEVSEQIPDGDQRPRLVCDSCGTVVYFNPRIVSGVIALTKDRAKVLLVKRTIPPVGKWTLPAGFMEIGETSSAGAKREAMEEANAHLEIGPILSVYNILAAAQVQILYLAYLVDERVSAGSETSEAKLFSWDALPWDELAFSTILWALSYAHDNLTRIENIPPQLRTKQWDGTFTDD